MSELSEIRAEINRIDDEIVSLFVRRLEAVGKIAEAKRASGKAVVDAEREKAVKDRVRALAGEKYGPYADLLFTALFDISKARQRAILCEGRI
jgi:chorismate mutase/prephenate dehydratase